MEYVVFQRKGKISHNTQTTNHKKEEIKDFIQQKKSKIRMIMGF